MRQYDKRSLTYFLEGSIEKGLFVLLWLHLAVRRGQEHEATS